MTRSIFDPTGPNTERSGSRYLGPDAGNNSRMPPDAIDGEVSAEEVADAQLAGHTDNSSSTADVGKDTAKIAEAAADLPADDRVDRH